MRGIPSTEKLFVGGDFKHIGSLLGGYNDVHSGFNFGERNEGEVSLLDLLGFLGCG